MSTTETVTQTQADVTHAQIQERKEQWVAVSEKLQQQLQRLIAETSQVQQQIAQISGAIQACDVLLQGTDSAK